MADDIWPSEIRLVADRQALLVRFDDRLLTLPAELLRVESPSAEVRGHSPAEKKLVPGKSGVRIKAVEAVGNYAVRLTFDDGHSTGIYGWAYLAELGRDPNGLVRQYRDGLAAAGLSHEPLPPRFG
ncbi:gamma-butyrobetaine hydroxylase-like domain-containing protein [uncultured Enterovirga sp.]|uniref:gamma-butyrobetaine hydroxylase-like domain-containing protein n=1 Tax=uncultured Enterovirga sp. TaxID=2026352 RepID=UPI0035C9EC64